ncbi:Glycoside hydrolase family 16 protein [Pyrenophora teres f. maculata]|nr:Glycoside hydrolase family 16 protein [Pyrenophora teres f. maculata]
MRQYFDMFSGRILLLALNTSLCVVAATAECTRFSTNGTVAATYDYYRFFDFRQLRGSLDETAASSSSREDGVKITESSKGQSKIVAAAPWNADWTPRDWFRPAPKEDTVDMYYTPSQITINNDAESTKEQSTYLTLHTTRLPNGTQLAAELDFAEHNATFASMRMLARIRGASGAVAGFFTYHNDTTESDIEIPTGGASNELYCSNQPTTDPDTNVPIQGATFNVSLEAHEPASAWNSYRMDWTSGRSVWYVNGVQSADTEVNVPDTESRIILNLWSNGGNFSGRMATGEEAWFDIQWVELLFNTTASPSSQDKGTACSVEKTPGSPVPSSSVRLQDRMPGCLWWMVGLVSAVSLVTFM